MKTPGVVAVEVSYEHRVPVNWDTAGTLMMDVAPNAEAPTFIDLSFPDGRMVRYLIQFKTFID